MATAFSELDISKKYSYADYLLWQFQERVELIKGSVLKMSPAPSYEHQVVSGNLFLAFGNHLKGTTCKVLTAPFIAPPINC